MEWWRVKACGSASLAISLLYWSAKETIKTCEPQHDKTNKMTCVPSRLRSAGASAQSDQSWLCILWIAKDPMILHADSGRLWSDWVDAQTDLILRWAHRSFCWFCRAAAHVFSQYCKYPKNSDNQKIAAIILKLGHCGFTMPLCAPKMQTEWQTV